MTPKEKAEELYSKYYNRIEHTLSEDVSGFEKDIVKHLSLIVVDECIESTKQLIHHYTKGSDERYVDIYLSMSFSVAYWQEVKKEIQNG